MKYENFKKDFEDFKKDLTTLAKEEFPECEVTVRDVTKNNGDKLHGMVIKKEGCNMAPTIYLDGYYQDYQMGTSLENIISDIRRVYAGALQPEGLDFNVEDFQSFSPAVQSRIYVRLVSRDRNEKLLKTIPYKSFLDLAITFSYMVSDGASIQISNNILQCWNTDVDALYALALKNAETLNPSNVINIVDILKGMGSEVLPTDAEYGPQMYVASNKSNVYGASVILYPHLLRDFAEAAGQDIAILPSSVHECLFVPVANSEDMDTFRRMVQEVNPELNKQDFLSNNVYYYSREEDKIVIA